MLLLKLEASSGHILTVAEEAASIAAAFPQHQFILSFNKVDINLNPMKDAQQIRREYEDRS